MDKKKKREIIEWAVILGVMATLYFTGLHTEVIGTLQRGILATGIMSPSEPESTLSLTESDYQFQLEDLEGKVSSFSDLKGKTVFINLWATWCPPCIAEMPEIQDLYDKVGSDKVVFVMISLDDERDKAIKFIQKKEYTFPVYTLVSGLPAVFHSQSIPTTFVIAPNGQVKVQQFGMASYDTEDFRNLLLSL
ncbi:TlpA disulfide reductase family protein [uncultured Imperialibacter sp.]|uniref:TlpA family protein disulfide reductase n=1 Tax=uncultured Imperialibacter sp. TaxID=1672639 RepID=UPI0030DCBA6E|tara:strand:+ start:1431 stop:2006 length:576 start_codon:yes stop_codon:yes gene_type:complete